ncbi:methyltransferase domain-containing protein [Pseudonocardia dioxanivorans]|uniref:methyltransferase domain-containing protein n=1 Tax=Pseudonocardia dioxanivorans TaxID=240495 RepID=UPI000CD258CE|nr:methyltransferase domain-containing protein [Pseudonocardia dioxanivorans]
MLEFGDEEARRLDRSYATSDVVAQRAQVLDMLRLRRGERVLDVGSGPGYLLASMAEAVGPAGAVQGMDPSPAMNAIARQRCAAMPWATVGEGDACALPYPDGEFDVVVATQVYEYVTDMPAAIAEVARVLRPGGRVVVLDTDWDSLVWNVADRARHERIVAAWEEHLADSRLPRRLAGLLRRGGFEVVDQRVIPLFNPRLHADTFSANIMETIAAFVPGRRGVTAQDAADWLADLRARAAEDEYLFSLNRYVVAAVRL